MATNYSNFRVIVADNGSSDDSIDYLRKAFPQVELIIFNENHGFAKGYNEALKELSADYYMLLNSDVEVESGWLQPMVDLLMKEEKAVACQPKILAYKDKHLFEYAGGAGGWLDLFGYPFARGRIFDICEVDTGQFDKTEEVFWASGAAMLIKSEVYHQLKGFDEYFFAHQEEIDLCWRLINSGRKIFYTWRSEVYHVGGGTLNKQSPRKTFLNIRNNLSMVLKNAPFPGLIGIIFMRLCLDAFAGIYFGIKLGFPHFIAVLKAHFSFYAHASGSWKKRQKHQKNNFYQSEWLIFRHFLGRK